MSIKVDVLRMENERAMEITVRGSGKREDKRLVVPWDDVGELYLAITEALATQGDGAIRVTEFDACYYRALTRARRQNAGLKEQRPCPSAGVRQ